MTKKEIRSELDRTVLHKMTWLIETIRDEHYIVARQDVDCLLGVIDFAEDLGVLKIEDWETIMTTLMDLRYKMENRFKDYVGKYTEV